MAAAFPEGRVMRILVTDSLHPVTSETVCWLRRAGVASHLVGVWPGGSPVMAPPGLDAIEAVSDSSSPGYWRAVLAAALAHRVDVVMPWSDADAKALAGHVSAFAASGVGILCPPAELVALACDKWRTIGALEAAGLPVPRSRLVTDADQLTDTAQGLGYPTADLILKVRDLAGSRGVWTISARSELAAGGPLPAVCLEAMAAQLRSMRHDECPDGLVLQETIIGTDISVDVVARRGTLLAGACRTRKATLGGLCISGEVFPLDGDLAASVQRLVSTLEWDGIANLQAVVDRAGRAVFYEINPRTAGSVGLTAGAGLDLLAGALRLASGSDPWPGQAGCLTVTERVAFRRHWSTQQWTVPGARCAS